jgi:hypothetical protein
MPAVDASTVNRPRASDAKGSPGFQADSEPRPTSAPHLGTARTVPDVDGRGRFAWRPLLVPTDRRPNFSFCATPSPVRIREHSNRIFTIFSNVPSEMPTTNTNPWRRCASAPAVPRSRPVKASQTLAPSIRPFGHRPTPSCCTFCCTFCCIKLGRKPATKPTIASPSTTCTQFTLQQPLGHPTVKMTAPVAISPRARIAHRWL